MIHFALLTLSLTAVLAQDGTCVAGLDPIGVEQSCLGRCHIYYEGNYGACNSYQVTAKDANGPCGDSVQNACISTFNAGWDSSLQNCGNCYYVEMAYEDGTVRSTYLKTIDTNGSETKFEMSQIAWTNLCPYLCAGTGTCGNKPEACQYGVQDMTGMPAPCAVQNAPITFKRVSCDGSDSPSGGSSSGGSGNGGHSNGGSSSDHHGSGGSSSGSRRTTKAPKRTTTSTPRPSKRTTTTPRHGSSGRSCADLVKGTASQWDSYCQEQCSLYVSGGARELWCKGATPEAQAACVVKEWGSACQRA